MKNIFNCMLLIVSLSTLSLNTYAMTPETNIQHYLRMVNYIFSNQEVIKIVNRNLIFGISLIDEQNLVYNVETRNCNLHVKIFPNCTALTPNMGPVFCDPKTEILWDESQGKCVKN